MHLKSDFRKRVIKMRKMCGWLLDLDEENRAECSYNFLPDLFKLFTVLWCHKYDEFLKK